MNIKLLKKGFGLSLCVALMMGCAKEEVVTETSQELEQTTETRSGLCDLEVFTGSNYSLLAQELTGLNFGDDGSIDGYFACEHGTPGAGGACCGPTSGWVDGFDNTLSASYVEFESWGPNTGIGQYNLLADGVCTIAEQEDFIDRVYAAAAAATPPCSSGGYSPVAYEVEWSPIPGGTTPGVSILLNVTYTANCFMFF